MIKYGQSHGWAHLKEGVATVGITTYAQQELGEVVYLELPKIGQRLCIEDIAAVLESTKAATDIYAPLSGEVVEVNQQLVTHPNTVNTSAEKEGWLFKLKIDSLDEYHQLMSHDEYLRYLNI